MTKSSKNYSEMLKSELLTVAHRLGLNNLSRLRKDEIVDLIKKAAGRQERASAAKSSSSAAGTGSKSTTNGKKSAAKRTVGKATRAKATGKRASAEVSSSRSRTYRAGEVAQMASAPAGPVSAQADVQATKYSPNLYSPEELQGVDEMLPALPETYGDNRIVLLPRDPAWLFAYWNLTHEYKEAARAAGGRVLALRLYDVTGNDFDGRNAAATYEHECAEWARSWYLPAPAPGREYIVEIGYRGGEDWYPLARSRRVRVPTEQPSTHVREDFATIGFEEQLGSARDRLPAGEPPTETSPAPPPLGYNMLFDDGELRIVVGGALLNPSGAPTWPISSEALQAAGVPGSLAHVPGSWEQVAGSWEQVAGSVSHLPGSLGQLPGSLGQLPHAPGSLGLLGALPGGIQPSYLATAAGAAPGHVGAPVVLEDANQPMLQAYMELIISGRSFPNTEVSIAGRTIPVGPDGAFSLRVSVPEGIREVPIEARSHNTRETRCIRLRFGSQFE